MIIFSTVVNNGGMVRIAEWCARTKLAMIGSEEILFIVFCPTPLPTTKKDIIFIEWSQNSSSYTEQSILKYRNEVKEKLAGRRIDKIIGDYQTLCYYDYPEAPLIYDVHVLGRSLYNSVSKYKDLQKLDEHYLKLPLATMIDLTSFQFLKFEHKYIKSAKAYLVNSENSRKLLLADYADEVLGKPIHYIPLPFLENAHPVAPYSERSFIHTLYTFGRLHPQKGHHLLFEKNWKDLPLVIRGVDSTSFKPEGLKKLQEKNVTLLDWSHDPDIIKKDLLRSRFVIFPSIHEPWGLALQEAMNLGCVCVANSRGEGHLEQIEHGQNGFLIDMAASDWQEKLELITKLPVSQLEKISERAQKSSGMLGGDARREESLAKKVVLY